jgi:Ni/Co efflux regulator RcnB
MRVRTCLHVFIAAIFALGCGSAFAQDEGRDHDRGRDREEFREDHDRDRDHFYNERDHDAMRGWYREHHDHLPPGLRDRDRLPPGLERQLVVRGTLPPGLRSRMFPCPEELERRLPPPPPDCAHVIIGGHIVLLNRANFQVVDVFHFEL